MVHTEARMLFEVQPCIQKASSAITCHCLLFPQRWVAFHSKRPVLLFLQVEFYFFWIILPWAGMSVQLQKTDYLKQLKPILLQFRVAGLLPSWVICWLSSRPAFSRHCKVFEHLQLLPNGIWQENSHRIAKHHIHFSVFLVRRMLIFFIFAENKSAFWLQGGNC